MRIHIQGARSPQRQTDALPGWQIGGGQFSRTQSVPKPTPFNIRRFSESPIARRAINAIKNPVAALSFEIRPIKDADALPDQEGRIKALTYSLHHPNHDDSFRSLLEQVAEDILIGAYGAIEVGKSANPERPLWLWPVDGSTVELFPGWEADPRKNAARYAQKVGFGANVILLRNDELIYIKTNPRTSTPFGLSPMDVAFETINAFLTANAYAAKAASNQTPRGIINVGEEVSAEQVATFRNYWRNEIEGRGILPVVGGGKTPAFIPLFKGDDTDMRMGWQEFLVRIIGSAFGLSPVAMGLERDVNRNTADVMREMDQDNAIKPMAHLIAEHINREAIHRKLGWRDLEFVWTDLDQEDDEQLSRINGSYLDRDVLLPNEVREKMGLEPLPGEWGNLTRSQRLVLIAQAAGTAVETENPALQSLKDAFAPPAPASDTKTPKPPADDAKAETQGD